MVKKKSDEHPDLTRIEDLSEFLHEKDSDLDSVFDNFSIDNDNETEAGVSLDELDDESFTLSDNAETPPDLPVDLPLDTPEEEITFEATSIDEITFEENESESSEGTSFGQNPFASESSEEDSFDLPDISLDAEMEIEEIIDEEEVSAISESFQDEAPTSERANYTNTSESFVDVKTFAQNFSYGKASLGGGNPPYTIIARNIKFQEDAENILDLLEEFGVLNEQNKKDTQRAIELGSLIIPQISEYTAIILAHKLRRFDLDLEVGLSDEVHPSKSSSENPKGLLKKDSLKQNRTESLKLSDIETPIKDIIVTTAASLPGFMVESYIGVQTTFAIVEEAELEKLQYVEKAAREHSEIFDYDGNELSTEKAFKDYQNSFALLYEDLAQQLKQKAFKEKANALIGLNFQLSPLQFERFHTRVNAYQITCSATLAIVKKDHS